MQNRPTKEGQSISRILPLLADDAKSKVSPWLSDISPKHAIWDTTKASADQIAAAYAGASDLTRYAERVGQCSEVLLLTEYAIEAGNTFKAVSTKCHVRHCPICQRSRAKKLREQISKAVKEIGAEYPKGRWLFLTLTLEKPEITDLRTALGEMNRAWQRLIQRKEFRTVQGWLRSTEVTRGAWIDVRTGKEIDKKRQLLEGIPREYRCPKDPTKVHPHFHALLFVPSHYFTGQYYLKHERWIELWQESAKVNYAPSVKIKAVDMMKGGIEEVIKTASYSVKAEEVAGDENDVVWFQELHRQTHKLRFYATGGILKDKLKIDNKEADDVTDDCDEGTETGWRLLFDWQRKPKRYRKKSEKLAD